MSSTYTSKELSAHAMHDRPGYFFTAAGTGYRLYNGTSESLSFVAFFRTYDELFAAAEVTQ